MSAEDRVAVETMLIDVDIDIKSIPYTAPPGEEGANFSHEGGEYEVFKGLAQQMADFSGLFLNECLIYHGYLGCSLLHLNIVISLHTLAAYRQSHRTCPQFSIQLQCKALCHLHDVHHLIVLSIIKAALKHDTPDWCLLNLCPCCCYKLDDKDDMTFEWLATIDGNNSLKQWSSTIYGTSLRDDSRTRHSDYWLQPTKQDSTDDWEDVVQSDLAPFNCVNHWRNAGLEAHKHMFSIFDESGIFIAACRHRFILLVCDMVKSGELSKYPLAILDHLLNVYRKNCGVAYNIGCAFSKTLDSSCLGPRARELNLQMMVGAFHGHAHNQQCQIDWHLMYIEGCEHIFSLSNELARSTCHATPFHWHQTIKQHFAFWDDDKYAVLKALTAIQTLSGKLSSLEGVLNLTHADFVRFHGKSAHTLTAERSPLKEWNTAREAANWALVDIHVGGFQQMHTAINQAWIRVDRAYSMLQNAEVMASHLEIQLEINNKALQHRSQAIWNALGWFNLQAAALVPPRPQLTWKDIVEYSFLGEFDLLRQSRSDICTLDWTKPVHREATVKYFKLQHAHEEIQCLNIKICRLHTAIHDGDLTVNATINSLLTSNEPIGLELQSSDEQSCGDILKHEEQEQNMEDFADYLVFNVE
ncbi:hypothetical protein P692DRAFT_20851327 [Suillus brevipes Sb2]|nr:hypothetical protein P692DRAFT_20851327 [Suillus brevipes Sb2]